MNLRDKVNIIALVAIGVAFVFAGPGAAGYVVGIYSVGAFVVYVYDKVTASDTTNSETGAADSA